MRRDDLNLPSASHGVIMKGFLIILVCLVLVLLAAFHPQAKRYGQEASAWFSAYLDAGACDKDDRESQQACAEQQNRLAGKIDARLDMTDQQRALNKALEN